MTADDHALARELAAEAGRRLLELRARGGEPDALRKAGDRLAHEFLAAALAGRRPGDMVLSEEAADDKARLDADRVWIIDPLDGTREFGDDGRADWAVHVALWERSPAGSGTAARAHGGGDIAGLASEPTVDLGNRLGARPADRLATEGAGNLAPGPAGRPGAASDANHAGDLVDGLAGDRAGAGAIGDHADSAGGRLGDGPAGRLAAGAIALPAQGIVLSTATRDLGKIVAASIHDPLTLKVGRPFVRPTFSTEASSSAEVPKFPEISGMGGMGEESGTGAYGGGDSGATGAGRDGGAGHAGAAGVTSAGAAGGGRLRIVVSRSRAPRIAAEVARILGAELVPWGSAGAKVAAVITGEVDAYVHAGGFYEWDTAAPVAVAWHAGLHASRIDGSPLAYNQANLLLPDILVCRPALAGTLLTAIREAANAI